MRRIALLASAVSVAAVLTYGTALAAPGDKTVRIVGGQQFIPDVSFTDTQRFEQKVVSVQSGQTISWHNTTDEPHTISIVAPADVPKTVQQVQNCQQAICGAFLAAHSPNIGPNGPQPPFVFFVDNLAPSAGPATFDSTGDSLVVAPHGAQFPSTTGGMITDTVSAVVSAPAGSTFRYMCTIHPWMQATIRVTREREDNN